MHRTGAARADHLLSQRLPSPKHPDAGIVRGDPDLRRVVLHRKTIDLDPSQRVRVLGFEIVGEPRDAPAYDILDIGRRHFVRLQLACEQVESSIRRAGAPLMIDDGVAEHPVEPGAERLFLANLPGSLDAAHERFLQDVLRHGAAADSLFHERKKGPMVRNELHCPL